MLSLALHGQLTEKWGTELRYARYWRSDNLDYSLYYASRPETANLVQIIFTVQ
jgi:hypothetical protein